MLSPRFFKIPALTVALLGATLSLPVHGRSADPARDPKQMVVIQGQVAHGGSSLWRTYSNGVFGDGALPGDGFKVPNGQTLVILGIDTTFEASDNRPWINLEVRLVPPTAAFFPLARISCRNQPGILFTNSRAFDPGLAIPGGNTLSVVDKGAKPGKFEVTIYGYYAR